MFDEQKVMIEVDAQHEAIVRRALALAEEREQSALTASDGAVSDACEEEVMEKGRTLQAPVLGEAVARRIEAAEKKGAPTRLCACGRKKENCRPKERRPAWCACATHPNGRPIGHWPR